MAQLYGYSRRCGQLAQLSPGALSCCVLTFSSPGLGSGGNTTLQQLSSKTQARRYMYILLRELAYRRTDDSGGVARGRSGAAPQ